MGSLTHLLRDRRSPEAIWTYRCLLIFNLLMVVSLGFRYLEYHLMESFSGQSFYLIQLTMIGLLIPLKLAFLYSIAQMGKSMTLLPAEAGMRKIEICIFTAVGLAVLLSSATAFIIGYTRIAFGIHNVFEIFLIAAMIGFSCWYGNKFGNPRRQQTLICASAKIAAPRKRPLQAACSQSYR